MYSKRILPILLKWGMKRKSFSDGRRWCMSQVQGVVLEIGFGAGANLSYYSPEKVSKIIAVEPNNNLLAISEHRKDIPVEIFCGYADNIPYVTESIDTVVITWTLCSIDDAQPVVREIHRLLKPNGKIVFIEHGKSKKKILANIQSLFSPLWSRCMGGCKLDKSYWGLFEKNGFSFETKKQTGTEYRGVAVKK